LGLRQRRKEDDGKGKEFFHARKDTSAYIGLANHHPREAAMQGVGVGRRAVAIIIDMIVLGIIGWALGMAMGGATSTGFNLSGAPAFIWFLIALAYYVVMEVQMGGTLGKLAMGLKVVKESGEKMDWQASIIRNLLRIIDGIFFYLVGAIIVWVSKKKQRLGDIVEHTLVVPK